MSIVFAAWCGLAVGFCVGYAVASALTQRAIRDAQAAPRTGVRVTATGRPSPRPSDGASQ